MGYIENLQAQAEQVSKAKAYDEMQKQVATKDLTRQAYEQGMQEAVSRLLREQQMRQLSPEEQLMNRQYQAMDSEVARPVPVEEEEGLARKVAPVRQQKIPKLSPVSPLEQRQYESMINQTEPGVR